jgi:hypothetical protein
METAKSKNKLLSSNNEPQLKNGIFAFSLLKNAKIHLTIISTIHQFFLFFANGIKLC